MPLKINDGLTNSQRYALRHPERRRKQQGECRARRIVLIRYQDSSPKRLLDVRNRNDKLKEAVMNVYTNGEGTCRRCGQGDIDVLCLDHIEDDGGVRRRNGEHRHGNTLYRWIVTNGYPSGLQVLCSNCNLKKEVVRRRLLATCRPARASS